MLYYYFGRKELLYVAVLESMYADYVKKESELDLSSLQPREAMAALATSIWAHLWDNPEWIGLVNNENLHQGRYLKTSQKLSETISPVVEVVRSIFCARSRCRTVSPGHRSARLLRHPGWDWPLHRFEPLHYQRVQRSRLCALF